MNLTGATKFHVNKIVHWVNMAVMRYVLSVPIQSLQIQHGRRPPPRYDRLHAMRSIIWITMYVLRLKQAIIPMLATTNVMHAQTRLQTVRILVQRQPTHVHMRVMRGII